MGHKHKKDSRSKSEAIDPYDYYAPSGRSEERRRSTRRPKARRKPQIVDDWPDEVPLFVEELELYELYFGDELDRIFGFKE